MISIKGLNFAIGRKPVLTDVNFEWDQSEIIGVVGRNGSGKTSLFKCLLQLGMYKNESVDYPEMFQLNRDLGFLSEARGLFMKETVQQNLENFALLSGAATAERQRRTEFWLEFFELDEHRKTKAFELSKGNQQRVQFIAAALQESKYLILDEPFSGVDPLSADVFLNAIRHIRDRGCGIIYSSHQMEYVEELADRVLFVRGGTLVEGGSPSTLRGRYTTASFSKLNTLHEFLNSEPSAVSVQARGSDKYEAAFRNSGKMAALGRGTKVRPSTLIEIFRYLNDEASA